MQQKYHSILQFYGTGYIDFAGGTGGITVPIGSFNGGNVYDGDIYDGNFNGDNVSNVMVAT